MELSEEDPWLAVDEDHFEMLSTKKPPPNLSSLSKSKVVF